MALALGLNCEASIGGVRPKEKSMSQSFVKSGMVTALGAMSGTSLDGVDAAVVVTDGVSISTFGPSDYMAYSDADRATIAKALGQWQGAAVARAQKVVQRALRALLSGFSGIDLVGFHGQTLAHDPQGRRTLQIGDGAALADGLKAPVVWDFRSADVAAGGEGAPLAPFFHHACARYIGATQPLVFLNLGGVGNLTYVDPQCADPADAVLAFDTGPANAPINDLMQARLGKTFDRGGRLAASGRVDRALIERAIASPFFQRPPPKSLDRNDFSFALHEAAALGTADAAATLTALVVEAVAQGLTHCPHPPAAVLVTGGGRHNDTLMAWLDRTLPCPVQPVEQHGLDGDMLEAQAFAFLAVRAARGMAISAPSTTRVPHPMTGGRISWPGAAP
jgi:anhydro-N-acetylmuramic acid kinase